MSDITDEERAAARRVIDAKIAELKAERERLVAELADLVVQYAEIQAGKP